ncbi:MAG: hypothetical protein CME06_04250 [Gemmatimonadetes bacterium]|nr:hypothetical protein [Gemmatimonadota bacterium]
MPGVAAQGVAWLGGALWRDGAMALSHGGSVETEPVDASGGVEVRFGPIRGEPTFTLDLLDGDARLLSFAHRPEDDHRGLTPAPGDDSPFPRRWEGRLAEVEFFVGEEAIEVAVDGHKASVALERAPDEVRVVLRSESGLDPPHLELGGLEVVNGSGERRHVSFAYGPRWVDLRGGSASARFPWVASILGLTILTVGAHAVAVAAARLGLDRDGFATLPVQWVGALALARGFQIPLADWTLFAMVWGLVRIDGGVHSGIVEREATRPARLRWVGWLLMGTAGAGTALVHVAQTASQLAPDSPDPRWFLLLALVAWAWGTLASRGLPQRSAALFWTQLALVPLVDAHLQPGYHQASILAFWATALGTWVAARSVVNARALPVVAALGILIPAVSVELGMRSPVGPLAQLRLDYVQRIESEFWDIEGTTDLFGRVAGADSLAFKGRSFSVARPDGIGRIVCLGSSSTWGSTLPDTPTHGYPAELERILCDKGVSTEVINGGIEGAGLFMLATYLEDRLLPLEPDAVILYYGKNTELARNHALLPEMERLVEEHPWIDSSLKMAAALELRWDPQWVNSLYVGSMHLYSLVAVRELAFWLTRFLETPAGLERARQLYPWRSLRVPPKHKVESLAPTVVAIVDLCAERGIPLILVPEVVVPELWGGGIPYRGIFESLSDLPGVVTRRVDRALLAPPRDRVFNDDVHLTEWGCWLLAEELTPAVLAILDEETSSEAPVAGSPQVEIVP